MKMMRDGKVCVGLLSVMARPAAVEAIGYSGFHFVIIDDERAALSPYRT